MGDITNPFASPIQTAIKTGAPAPAMPSLTQPQTIISPKDIFLNAKEQRADLVWGPSNSGKGINAWFAIYWMFMTYGKKSLYLTAEPGALNTSIMNAARAGMVDIFNVTGQPNLLACLSSVLEGGMWPIYLKRGDSIVRSFNSIEAKCNPKEYGLLVVDALGSMGDEILKWFALPGKVTIPMTMSKEKFNVEDSIEGGLKVDYKATGMTQIGEACRLLQRYVISSAALPYMRVLWIAREQRASKGEKKDKEGNIIVAGEPMYGPDLPGTAATPRVRSWFGGCYHTARVPLPGILDDRKDAATGSMGIPMPAMTEKLTRIPKYEYRLYLSPHPDPTTGILYDAGNRLEAYLNSSQEATKPYIVCTEEITADAIVHHGLNDVWELERTKGAGMVNRLQEIASKKLADLIKEGVK